VSAEFYKLLVYEPGSFFRLHRDNEVAPLSRLSLMMLPCIKIIYWNATASHLLDLLLPHAHASTENPRGHMDEFLLHMRIEKKQARAVFDSRLRPF